MENSSKMRASECWPILTRAAREGNRDLRAKAIRLYRDNVGTGIDDLDDPMVEDFYEMLCAYEFQLWQKNGKNTAAAYTRRALKAKGVYQFSVERTLKGGDSQGFESLVRADLSQFTVEALVVRYPDRFPEMIVRLARQRLGDAH